MELLSDKDFLDVKGRLIQPNILRILRLEYYEIRHSNFLAWLLDNNESHNCGSLFSAQLLNVLFPCSSTKNMQYEIFREKDNIDLMLINPDQVLIIENKIKAKDQQKQLSSYRSYAKEKYPTHSKSFSYLTPKGEEPVDKDERNHWQKVSYENVIRELEEILNTHKSKINNRAKMYIEDYIFSIKVKVLKNHHINKLCLELCEKYKIWLSKYINGETDHFINSADHNVIKFILKHNKKEKGKGLFKRDDRWFYAFNDALQSNGCVALKGNSTYFSYLTKDLFDLFGDGNSYVPLAFNMRMDSNGKPLLRWSATINPACPNNTDYLEKIIKNRHLIIKKLPELGVKNFGKNNNGVIRKATPFKREDFSLDNLSEEIGNYFEEHFLEISTTITQVVIQILNKNSLD